MTQQKTPPIDVLRHLFAKHAAAAEAALPTEIKAVIEQLSQIIRDLRDAGLDVGLTFSPGLSEDAKRMATLTTAGKRQTDLSPAF